MGLWFDPHVGLGAPAPLHLSAVSLTDTITVDRSMKVAFSCDTHP
jgi:hypothetical protein